ncbi:MAG: SIMPL domain-containing protein [Muribaculaceae bacterium]|nr:SIMPL domain-containing protein [Muribaculaceae bacterium]
MKRNILILICLMVAGLGMTVKGQLIPSNIEVTGSATINIVPDRITVEIGMEEYYKQKTFGDSTLVKLSEIEKKVRKTLTEAGVPESRITVTDMGNYRNPYKSDNFLMAKRISATVTDFDQIEKISDKLERRGITSFNILKIDNSDMESYNKQGLVAALNAAKEKADNLAETAGLNISYPVSIEENGPNYFETPSFSNVAFDSGNGIEGMRRIVRRYSVKVKYLCTIKNQ